MDAAIYDTSGPMLVIGNSQGSLPTDAVRAKLENDPNAPLRSQLSFLVNGDPEQRGGLFSVLFAPGTYIPILDYTVLGPVESQYDLVVFTYEYDGIADFPDRPWNLIADLNALFGVAYRHAATGSLNPYAIPAEDITVTTNSKGATTTTYLGRAEHLPLTQPLRIIGVSADLVNAIDSVLRPIIDAGYSRNDSGPFHGPTFSGGQFHPPTLDLPNAVVQPNVPLVAGISGTDTSTKTDTGVAASTAPKNAVVTNAVDSVLRPNADANSVRGDNAPISSGSQLDPPTVRRPETSIQDTAIKRVPLLNVIRGADTSTKTEVGDGAGTGPKNTAEQDSDEVGNTGAQSAESGSSAAASASNSTDTSQVSN